METSGTETSGTKTNNAERRKNQSYSAELKREVCNVALEGRHNYTELGIKYSLCPKLISTWVRGLKKDGSRDAFRGKGNRAELELENFRIKQENNTLKEEVEILKKAAAYFAKNLG